MDKNKYCVEVWSKGKEETKKYYKEDRRGWTYNILSAIFFAIVTPAVGYFLGVAVLKDILMAILVGIIAGGIVFGLWYFGTKIYFLVTTPARIYYKQQEIINDLDKKLSTLKNERVLKLKLSPTKFENQRPLCLLVKNYEKRKIVELEAKIRFVYKYFLNAKKEISIIGWRVDSENILEQSDVRPNDELSGIIANFSDDFSGIKFGKSREDYFINSNEAIYTIQLSYCGKIEGEIDFRYKNIDVDIFVNQSKKLFCSAGYASQSKIINGDFEEKFLEYREKQKQESRKKIVLMKKKKPS